MSAQFAATMSDRGLETSEGIFRRRKLSGR